MKILHLADVHLDSKSETHLDKAKASERKAELLNTFRGAVEYAAKDRINVVLIAGDLFDTRKISATARKFVLGVFSDHPEITFYYLKGNHDSTLFCEEADLPGNVRLFSSEWSSYVITEEDNRKVVIYGRETGEDGMLKSAGLVTDLKDFNIVMLHGQESSSSVVEKTDVININEYANKGIDYMALGHIHSHNTGRIDARGIWCYPGCLEGRGFDESGIHGFTVLDIDTKRGTFDTEFIPFAKRCIYEISVDITGLNDSAAISSAVAAALKNSDAEESDYVRVLLTGETDVADEKNTEVIGKTFEDKYFCIDVKDMSRFKVNIDAFKNDNSLKGFFVRSVYADDSIDEADKAQVIRIGINALMGEEVFS